jgi:hypothetical protein
MARAELGQQTASGISFIGVKQRPPEPSLSFTPVKKIPITTRSTVMESRSLPRISRISPEGLFENRTGVCGRRCHGVHVF